MIRNAFRALGWLVSELVPAQAIRTIRGRDYTQAVSRAEAVLRDLEEEREVLEPQLFSVGAVSPDRPAFGAGSCAGEVKTSAESPSPQTVPSSALPTLIADLAWELSDAVGDHYDNGKAMDPSILWHESGIPTAIDWRGVARTLLMYFDIQRKPSEAERESRKTYEQELREADVRVAEALKRRFQ